MPIRALAAACIALATLGAGAANHDLVVTPLASGAHPVACTNVEQDPALIARFGGSPPQDFWEGRPANGQLRYLTQILRAPATALAYDVAVPDQRSLYPQFAGELVRHAAIVCHPTPADNFDPGYVLPETFSIVPHMQPAGAPPKVLAQRLPLVLFSHGLSGSPISPGHLEALVELASHGYVVAAVFHGDPRFSRVRLDDLGDLAFLLTQYDRFAEMQLMRPLALKALTDLMLAHPQFPRAIDATRIGAFGASMGGQAVANLAGARLTTSIGLACRETARDPRVRAAVGLVPYSGQGFLPSFCDDQSGMESMGAPYRALGGTRDTTAPLVLTRQAVNRIPVSHYLVELDIPHEYRVEYRGDVVSWTVTFLNAYLQNPADPGAMARLIRMRSVNGGPGDELTVDVHLPFAGGDAQSEWYAVEFFNERLEHYFIPATQAEVLELLEGRQGPDWALTGQLFKVLRRPPPGAEGAAVVPVCRFTSAYGGGANAGHFFTANPEECEAVRRDGGWKFEGIAFFARTVNPDGRCPEGSLAVLRAYNNASPRSASNHRFTTSDSTWREMARLGWTLEGTAMCARP